MHPQNSEEFIAHIEQAVAICHCIGCTFLLGGALIVSPATGWYPQYQELIPYQKNTLEIDHPADVFPYNQPDQLHHHDRVLLCSAG